MDEEMGLRLVIAALDADELSPDHYARLSKAVRNYSGRRFSEGLAKLGQAIQKTLGGIPPAVARVENCNCLCGAVHPGELGICSGEASTASQFVKRTEGGGRDVAMCGECARAHDERLAAANTTGGSPRRAEEAGRCAPSG